MMKLKKKLLSSAMAVALAGGMALSGGVSAMHVAEDGIGQVLMAPIYFANEGYTTKVAIVNTRTDVAVKAKVVFRSKKHTTEVLDFVCFLSPGDVCRFEVRYDTVVETDPATGRTSVGAYMWSDDDSVLADFDLATAKPIFASEVEGGLRKTLYDPKMLDIDPEDINEIGHMEVIGAYAAMGDIMVPDHAGHHISTGMVQVYQKMSKQELYRIFYNQRSSVGTPIAAGGSFNDLADIDAQNEFLNPTTSLIRSADPTLVQLTGFMEIATPSSDRMGYRIPALAGEMGDNAPSFDAVSGVEYTAGHFNSNDVLTGSEWHFDGRVISNPDYDAVVSQESGIGALFGYGVPVAGGVATIYDNIIEVEHALLASNLQGSYEDDSNSTPAGVNRTKLIVTFPTRYKHLDKRVCIGDTSGGLDITDNLEVYSDPFRYAGDVEYGLSVYDNQENDIQNVSGIPIFSGGGTPADRTATITDEVNYLLPEWPVKAGINMESGWFNMALIEGPNTDGQVNTSCNYRGIPTLSFMHKYRDFGAGIQDSWLIPVAHSLK